MPHVRPISGTELYEIRMSGRDGIARALFVSLEDRQLVILNVFIKKTQATPKQEIDLAIKRLKEAKNDRE